MAIFKDWFGKGDTKKVKEEKIDPWISLTSLDQLKEIENKSLSKPQFIFKHSTTCGISKMVFRQFENSYEFTAAQADLYYLDLHSYREVSNEAGIQFQVMHQSPQLLVIKNGTTVAHASHGAIIDIDLEKYI